MQQQPHGIGDAATIQRHQDICPHCALAILPGETHGEVVPGSSAPMFEGSEVIMATIRCRVRKLQQVEEVIEAPTRG